VARSLVIAHALHLRTDHPHVPQKRRRLDVVPIAAHTGSYPRIAYLVAIEDDDEIQWKEDPFDRPRREEPESQDKLLAMIHLEGTPALQKILRALCREYRNIFSTALRPLSAKVNSMVIDIISQSSCCHEKSDNKKPSGCIKLGIIEGSRATYWSQVHPVLKSPGKWQLTLDFVSLNSRRVENKVFLFQTFNKLCHDWIRSISTTSPSI
jgi:hypothetical protein